MSSISNTFWAHSRNSDKIASKFGWEIAVLMKNLIELWFNSIFNFAKLLTIFTKKIEFGAVQKDVNLVDLEKCCKMSIYLQNLASIQPRTSLSKFGGWFNSIFNRVLSPCVFRAPEGNFSPRCAACWPIRFIDCYFSACCAHASSISGVRAADQRCENEANSLSTVPNISNGIFLWSHLMINWCVIDGRILKNEKAKGEREKISWCVISKKNENKQKKTE